MQMTTNQTNIKLTDLYAEETEKVSQDRLYTLVKLTAPANIIVAPIYYVDNNFPINFGYFDTGETQDITYTPFPLKLQGINTTTDGSVDKTSITIGNVSREIMYYVEAYNGLSKWRVTIRFVYEKFLNHTYLPDGTKSSIANPYTDPNAYVEEEFLIDTYAATEQYVTFSLEPIIDLSVHLPRRRFMTDSCFWRYKSADTCKLVGGHSYDIVNGPCKKTLVECKARGNQLNFGGYPGVTGVRRLYI